MTNDKSARGIRNNNPGNIRRSNDPWQGLSQHQKDPSFFQFDNPLYGIRALARVLIAYQDKHNLRTITQIINRWAPPAENQTGGYITDICQRNGFAANAHLDLHKETDLKPLVEAIIWHENGQQPYSAAQLTKALVLAGVEPLEPDLKQTRTVKGGKAAVVATVGVGAIEVVQQSLDPAKEALIAIAPYVESVKWLLLALTLIGIGIMVWARIDDRRKGLR